MTLTFKSFCSRWVRKGALLLALTLLLTGCQARQPQKQENLRIGVALYTGEDTFISTITHEMEALALEKETEGAFKINLSVLDGRYNQTTQMDQIDSMINRGCDVICVNIVDRTAAAVMIDKAEEAGVPLIFFNRQPVTEDIQRWEQVYYVGASAKESGILQGEIVLEAWQQESRWDRNGDGEVQYVMLEGEPGHQDALLRTEYATKPLLDAEIPVEKLASETANWNRGQAMAQTDQWIRAFGDRIEVIFANNDDMALGAIEAYEAAGLELPLIVGVDATAPALEAVQKGSLRGTVLNDAHGIAASMMDMALALFRGEPVSSRVELTDGHYIWLPYRKLTAADLPLN